MKKDVTCGRSKWSDSQPRVCKYVRGRATESLLMTHTEKFHSKPYRTDVSYMSSLGPREGSGDQAPIPPKTGGLFIVILTALLFSCGKSKKSKNKRKAQAQLVRRALFPLRRTVQSSPHWVAQKQQAGDSFVERIHTFLSLLACLLLHSYNYPAVLKHTNLIE